MSNPERHTDAPERTPEHLGDAAAERSKELREKLENKLENKETEQHASAERAHIEALFSKEKGVEKQSSHADSDPVRESPTKKQREASYKQTMKRIQGDMSPTQRAFSKFIHAPIVEKASNVLGSTVVRPNAILTGSFSAFILVAVVYTAANTMGYRLSGFETIGAFILGWIIGIIYDFVKVMISGKRS